MKKPKTHYALCDRATESDNHDYWSATLCGLEYTESPLSDKEDEITCKNCLKVINNPQTTDK